MAARFSNRKKQLGTKGSIVFACGWIAFSSIFFFAGLFLSFKAIKQQSWEEVRCEVTHFQPTNDANQNDAFSADISFQYKINGADYVGNRLWSGKERSDDYEEIAEVFEQYRERKLNTCYVNPQDPNEAAIIISSEAAIVGIVFTLFGGLFIAIGVGLFVGALRKRREARHPTPDVSNKKKSTSSASILVFSIFALVGIGLFVIMVIPKWSDYHKAQSYIETPAEIVWSRVTENRDDDGTTYGVDVFYRYQYNGNIYHSNRYKIVSSSSSGRSAKQEKVNRLSRGTAVNCYVNPDQPWIAVMERELGWWALWALFPLPFATIGIWGLIYTFRKKQKTKSPYRKQHPYHHQANQRDTLHPSIHKEFSSRGGRVKKWLAMLFFALFWCGITSIFVVIAVNSWLRDDPEIFLTIFIIPFVLIGLLTLSYSFYCLAGIFSPAPTLKLKPSAITLGETCYLSWQYHGSAQRIRHFQVILVGEEKVLFSKGDTNTVKTSVFHEEVLAKTSDPRKIQRGRYQITLPTHTMPTWKTKHCQIVWSVHVIAEISLSPNIHDRHLIEVLPMPINL